MFANFCGVRNSPPAFRQHRRWCGCHIRQTLYHPAPGLYGTGASAFARQPYPLPLLLFGLCRFFFPLQSFCPAAALHMPLPLLSCPHGARSLLRDLLSYAHIRRYLSCTGMHCMITNIVDRHNLNPLSLTHLFIICCRILAGMRRIPVLVDQS